MVGSYLYLNLFCFCIIIAILFSASKTNKFDKVVKREICQVSSLGTNLPSVLYGDINNKESNATYLYGITERVSVFWFIFIYVHLYESYV